MANLDFPCFPDFPNIKKLILNTNKPLLIKNQMFSELSKWSLNDWERELGKENLKFRCGKFHYTKNPQWESKCSVKYSTFSEFLKFTESISNDWWYFDYKYLCEWLTNNDNINKKISWSSLGFTELNSNDSTLWIGSKGAHTSCHVDTYGCNIIYQVFGRKQWLLFPPEQNLHPTRIPYEESSIYSKLNFFSPKIEDFKGIKNCYKVILNPGEVLVVPHKWWHYVENLETAISINTWIPLPQDDFARIKESVASIFVNKIVNEKDSREFILNPNMLQEMIHTNDALKIINVFKEKSKSKHKFLKQSTDNHRRKATEEYCDVEKLLKEFPNISEISTINDTEFKKILQQQSERFHQEMEEKEPLAETLINHKNMCDLLNVILDEEVLELIAMKLIRENTN